MAGEERVCIATVVSLSMFDVIKKQKTRKDDYNFIKWSEVIKSPDVYLERVQGLIVSPIEYVTLTGELLTKMTSLKVVSSVGVGVDHLDIPLLRKYGIKVGYAPDVITQPTADLAFTLLMAIGRRIPEMMEVARSYEVGEKFEIERSFRRRGQDIFESTLGIIGLGKIGLEIAKRAMGFRMKILYHNRKQRSKEIEESVHATYVPTLEGILPQVDFLILCTPLTPDSRHMITIEKLKLMKSSSFLINIARGGIVKTDDLVEALRSKLIAGAALDATDPGILPKEHPLLNMPNVIVCPHAGVFTEGGLDAIYGLGLNNLRAAIENKPMPAEYLE
ncbi:glyoxylate reductase/hydroxypyruvate reductase-like [Lytechinus pictus]|uniref:glyoxylate reductase/hydroxypyruvate reductase-like n=1 Tax=Lytechinus pictus TaxID=7653 RepID=UPI0030B9C529